MRKFGLVFVSVVLALGCVGALAQDSAVKYFAEDAAPAFIVHNKHATSNIVVIIQTSGAGAANSISIASKAGVTGVTPVDGSGATDTIAEFVAALEAATNASAYAVIDDDCSLATDSTDGELLTGTYTATPGSYVVIPWDTSVALHFDTYTDSTDIGGGRYRVEKIMGAPGGTGGVTLSMYKNRTLVWGPKTFTSPEYVNPATWVDSGTNMYTNSFTAVNAVWLDETVNVPITAKGRVFVRATRVTTATTGGLSMTLRKE